jgi:hypothetical protein
MAYVVRRPGGSWEIRESVATPKGPRSRTLASFRRFTPAVVSRAVRAAQRPTSAAQIHEAARRAGAVGSAADAAARSLLAEAAAGRRPSPGLSRLLLAALGDATEHDPPGSGAPEWMEATPEQRGNTVRDLMRLTDRMPRRGRRPLAFPPLAHPSPADA